jgi:hypothetical protein
MDVIIDDYNIPRGKALEATKMIKKAVPYLKKEFSVPKDVQILLQYEEKDKDNKITLGEAIRYVGGGYACIINLNNEGHSILDTLAHEFTHIEQMYQCRLINSAHCFHWMESDKTIKRVDKATTFEEYRDYPWEIEARKRGRDFKNKYRAVIDPTIMDRVKKFFGLI